jgi:hypothetical protein
LILGPILGTIFGFIALNQIKQTGQGGRGLALAGMIISAVIFLGTVFLLILAAVVSTTSTDHYDRSGAAALAITVESQAVSHAVAA